MNNKFLKHFLVIGSGTFISMVIGFLTTPIITRIVSPTEYGQFSIFYNVLQYGLNGFIFRLGSIIG